MNLNMKYSLYVSVRLSVFFRERKRGITVFIPPNPNEPQKLLAAYVVQCGAQYHKTQP